MEDRQTRTPGMDHLETRKDVNNGLLKAEWEIKVDRFSGLGPQLASAGHR